MRSQFKQATMTPAACSCLSPAAQPGTNPLYLSQPLMCRKHTQTTKQLFSPLLCLLKNRNQNYAKNKKTHI